MILGLGSADPPPQENFTFTNSLYFYESDPSIWNQRKYVLQLRGSSINEKQNNGKNS